MKTLTQLPYYPRRPYIRISPLELAAYRTLFATKGMEIAVCRHPRDVPRLHRALALNLFRPALIHRIRHFANHLLHEHHKHIEN
jgi:hypothetical protein